MMDLNVLPKAWESLMDSSSFLPVIVKTIEKYHDTGWSMDANKHEFFEMVYMKKGTAIFEISGNRVSIGSNDIIIIKPNQPHKFSVESESGCEFIVLSFKFENPVNNQFSEVSLDDFLNFVNSNEDGVFITLKVSQKNEIITLMNKILKEQSTNEIGSNF